VDLLGFVVMVWPSTFYFHLLTLHGAGSAFCGTGCLSNCDALAECGPDAAPGDENCPLNVCCSQFGFVRINYTLWTHELKLLLPVRNDR
jgi:hypothetical protein